MQAKTSCPGIAVPEVAIAAASLTLPFAIRYSDMQTKEACNKDNNYHYTDDVENVHCVFRSRYARFHDEIAVLGY
jgi:hypothetical protein